MPEQRRKAKPVKTAYGARCLRAGILKADSDFDLAINYSTAPCTQKQRVQWYLDVAPRNPIARDAYFTRITQLEKRHDALRR